MAAEAKRQLIDAGHNIECKDGRNLIVWRIVADSIPDTSFRPEYEKIGVRGFDFQVFSEKLGKAEDRKRGRDGAAAWKDGTELKRQFPYLALLQHLWPGDWQSQLEAMNNAVVKKNWTL
jgi:hypothetical protein